MRFFAAARSAPFRYSLIFAGVAAVVAAALLVVIYRWNTELLDRHLEEAIGGQLAFLRADHEQDGPRSLEGLVQKHAETQADSRLHLLLKDGAGKMLAGDLPDVDARIGWQDLELGTGTGLGSGPDGGTPVTLRAFGARLEGGLFVLVARDAADTRRTQALLLRSFGLALVVVVFLALGGGVAIGNALLRRVEDVNRAARAIMDGDLSRRIPVVEGSDTLGGLVEGLNRMLGRIEDLMANLRQVTGNIAHDLRSPLGRHRQRLEAARLKPHAAREYERIIDAATEDIDSILKIFDAMLRIAEIEGGTPRERFTPVDLHAVCEIVADAFGAVAEDEEKKTLETRLDHGAVVLGDRELLVQMIVNLVENALRYTRVGALIVLSLDRTDAGPRLTVSDDGPGIPAADREQVFRPFYRLDASRSSPGSGLGLSLVRAIVRLHDATIALEDNAPGLKVTVAFPAAPGVRSAG